MNPAVFEFLDGKRYTLDSVPGTFRVDRWYSPWAPALLFEPDLPGRHKDYYRITRTTEGSAFRGDLTFSGEAYTRIAAELGFGLLN